jgi:DNA-3-methyladenine glycosylase II
VGRKRGLGHVAKQPVLKPRVAARDLCEDPVLGAWVRRIGPIKLPSLDAEPFFYLLRSICYQQLAGKAARTIHGRVVEALGGEVTPDRVLAGSEAVLRGAGLSGAKVKAVRDLANKVRSGEVEIHDLDLHPDDEIVRRLTLVRGIGVWTAQMYMLFRLRRPDVWPTGDLGVRAGYAKMHALEEYPSARELEPLGDPYRPWRSAAAWYCYRALETELS